MTRTTVSDDTAAQQYLELSTDNLRVMRRLLLELQQLALARKRLALVEQILRDRGAPLE
jgi:hypothetical protein